MGGKTVVESYNFCTQVNSKYQISDQLGEKLSNTIDSSVADLEQLGAVVNTLKTTSTKIGELNREYDLVTKLKRMASAASVISDAIFENVNKLNDKYDFVKIMRETTVSAIDSVKAKTSSE